ncbi:TolB family protein [Pelagicoccus mobilis]|uniref:TolB family protein n=1 Tax=Pelagicoccus mobilis TaxID=415221 RepID=UPI0035EA62F2
MNPFLLSCIVMTSQLLSSNLYSAENAFSANVDVGSPKLQGALAYDVRADEYTLSGAGENMWAGEDQFHFAYNKMKGDFIVRAEIEFKGEGSHEHRKAGWIIRESLAGDSKHVAASVHAGDGLTSLQFRRAKEGETEEVKSSDLGPSVVQLERRGGRYIMSTAVFGQTFATVESSEIELPDEVYVGLFVCSHDADERESVVFRNVRIVRPAPVDLVQYEEYIGSRLELLNVSTGKRTVVHTEEDSLQAPNWTVDGKHLIYNRNGKLYRMSLYTREVSLLDTGFADSNNNDHVLSFDGKWIGISHHVEEENWNSTIYTLPVSGGEPRKVTDVNPSYLHGWSPDGTFLIYTGGRNGIYNIYKIPSSGGEEIQLTDTPSLDDGSEYSPDGKYIYFNSARTGTMEIWRIDADGENPTQITNDEFNNWFPHVSPDGKKIVYLSYSKEVAADAHPFYEHVYLWLMDIETGDAKVIAYIYGGQGTINVPSWSPDSEYVAFVSNSIL